MDLMRLRPKNLAKSIKYLHDYDFSGLVEEKLKDSENKIAEVKKFNHLLHMCLLFVNACMIMTVLIIAVIIYL